jgi:hypothetical protein
MIAMVISDAVRTLDRDLRSIFGERLRSLVTYRDAGATLQAPTPTLAVIDALTVDDLRACADRVEAWHAAGLATPLMLRPQEFGRSLDAFPYEFGAILADYAVVSGENLFEGLRVNPADLRRACEVQVRGHLLHLREGYIETRGRSDAVAELITRSLPPLVALVRSIARLQGAPSVDAFAAAALVEKHIGVSSESTASFSELIMLTTKGPLSSDAARRIYPEYLDTLERLAMYIDRWTTDGH